MNIVTVLQCALRVLVNRKRANIQRAVGKQHQSALRKRPIFGQLRFETSKVRALLCFSMITVLKDLLISGIYKEACNLRPWATTPCYEIKTDFFIVSLQEKMT
uniref:Uncharacterized protein n=1 Tax=Steinernema glaseri TaxID=37863 RepID=A0A1I8AVC2_9BILA